MNLFIITCSYPDENTHSNGIFIHNQATALKGRGINVSVLFYDYRSIRRKRRMGLSKYSIDGINVFRFAFPCGPIPVLLSLFERIFAKKLFRYAMGNSFKPDLLHAHFFNAGYIALNISKKYSIDYIVTEHSSGILEGTITHKDQKKAYLVYLNAKKVISVSESLKKAINGIIEKKVHVIPNIVPNYFFENEKERAKTKSNCYSFVSIGNLIKRKRFDMTIAAFAHALNQRNEMMLTIVGSGLLFDELKNMTIRLGIENKVLFLGALPNNKLVEVFNHSNCFVLPSECETFGVVYAEAMACGLPVIATKCGGPEEFVNHENGLLIDNDVKQLSEAMVFMFDNRCLYKEKNISDGCRKKFSEKTIVDSLLTIYDSSLESNQK